MKIWLQRVSEASVTVDGTVIGRIGNGFLALVGVTHQDTEKEALKLADKIPSLRVFEDQEGKMNLSLEDIDGEVLVISQFTLYADTTKGRRPGYSAAARPEVALPLYQRIVDRLREILGAERVATGQFGADMKVRLLNDGPVSLELRSEGEG